MLIDLSCVALGRSDAKPFRKSPWGTLGAVLWWTYVELLLAGLGAGVVGSAAGLASLISYPVLLAVGLPPVTANVTNTVALLFSSAGSISGSRLELSGQAREMRRLAIAAVAGGVVGAAFCWRRQPTHSSSRCPG